MHPKAAKILLIGSLILLCAVLLGAFGAHGLKKILTEKDLATFKTGVSLQYYHGFGILFLGLIYNTMTSQARHLNRAFMAFLIGIIFFSLCCYLYALTNIKFFAMIVPIGGFSFIFGWSFLSWGLYCSLKESKEKKRASTLGEIN